MTHDQRSDHTIPLAIAVRVWLRISLLSFGGPAGQIAVMHRILVEETGWISEARFLHALNYCMLLPGPEAQQLVTYIGWLLHRTIGGVIAGTLFILPGAAVMLGLSILYVLYQDLPLIEAAFLGIKAAVLAIVVQAVIRIAARALKNAWTVGIAVAAFVGIFFLALPFPLIVLGAAGFGLLGVWTHPSAFAPRESSTTPGGVVDEVLDGGADVTPSMTRSLRVIAICLTLWFAPVIAVWLFLGTSHVFWQEGVFFSKMAVVTFGGAYAVLAYVAQQAVGHYGWLAPGEMLDGLGMAETTPGPLIMVVQFVGFIAAYRNPGMLDPMTAGVIGALLTTWVTFAPCFLWIFLGAPYVEALRGNRMASAALSAITAAVVGVILNLAIWFALHVLFGEVGESTIGPLRLYVPNPGTVDILASVIAAGAMLATLTFRLGMVPVLIASAIAGIAGSVLL